MDVASLPTHIVTLPLPKNTTHDVFYFSYTHALSHLTYEALCTSPNQRAISFLAFSTVSEPWMMLRPTCRQ